jgi:hypothetical protein
MTIIYPLSIPSILKPASAEFGGRDAIGMTQSPFSFAQEIQDWGGDMWTAKLSWPMIASRANGAPFTALLAALRGRFATVLLGDPLGATPRGAMNTTPGTPVVNGLHPAGFRTLALRGTPLAGGLGGLPAGTVWISAGDYIQVGAGAGSRLHMALLDVPVAINGQITLDIWPSLRTSLNDGTPILLKNCVGTFRLSANDRKWTESKFFRYGIELDFIEAI